MKLIMADPFETQAEREERIAAICGVAPETETEEFDYSELEEPLTVCHTDPWAAARDLCGCGGQPYV